MQTESLFVRGLDVRRMCEVLGMESSEHFVLLGSAAAPGRWSIIGVLSPHVTQLIRYTAGDSHVEPSYAGEREPSRVGLSGSRSVWRFLAAYMSRRRATGGKKESPFWGGLVGYFSYELGVESLGIPLAAGRERWPDVNFAFAERSVVDGSTGRVFVQSVVPDDAKWLESTKILRQQEHDVSLTPAATTPIQMHYEEPCQPQTIPPSGEAYRSLVRDCQIH